ncbi:MAG: hypothetical protein IBX50_04125 [Marinospirillum sp.]|uniref:hypothetical protein n=1 Tax=Marinospirillum sp. TaxID=2183934 RepID=UPI001A034861|nr:hypothetical protein [Marinospirillum sp.]MBE0505893.1 hypothetical protein [Marinospirillum sp.]
MNLIESIEVALDSLTKAEKKAIDTAIPLLVKAGYMSELPLKPSIQTAAEFKQAQDRLGMSNYDMAELLGCRLSLVEKMRAGTSPVRPLVGFVLSNLPKRIALLKAHQQQD